MGDNLNCGDGNGTPNPSPIDILNGLFIFKRVQLKNHKMD